MIEPPDAKIYYDSNVFWTSVWTDATQAWHDFFEVLRPLQIKSLINVGIGPNLTCGLWNALFNKIIGVDKFLNLDFDQSIIDKAIKSNNPMINNAKLCDIRQIDTVVEPKIYDAILWTHGPEHIKREEWPSTLAAIEKTVGVVILCCPWGSGYDYDNEHLSKSVQANEFEKFGYTTITYGTKDTKISGILAYKKVI